MFLFFFLCIGVIVIFRILFNAAKRKPPEPISVQNISTEFLEKEVLFYSSLSVIQKEEFRHEMARFLNRVHITGIETEITIEDRMMVSASAVIPIFHFPGWEDYQLDEVLIYPNSINIDFETNSHDSYILGMVGTGKMEGKMALSRKALLDGFNNKTDKRNTAIHEFIHLVDKADGVIDGIPNILMDNSYSLPWIRLIRHNIEEIKRHHSDIHEYGATNLSEFFAVAGEYFFERPDLLKIKHPELYALMKEMFTGKNLE